MSLNDQNPDHQPFDLFELVTAILLGLAAVGAALASLQSGQWGGKQLDAFSSSNSLTTKAANQYNEDTVAINADYAAVAAAKEHILEARDAGGQDRERHLDIASYQYSNQMSELGYKAMGLPMDYYIEDEEEEAEPAAAPADGAATEAPAAADAAEADPADPADPAAADDAAAGDAEEGEEEDPETAAATALVRDIPDEVLFASLTQELDDEYIDKALELGTTMFGEADKKFEEGRLANDNGDKFDLAGVIYTVGLFFAGLGLVFKTRIRWGFFAAGCAIFLGASIYLMTLPWA